MKVEVSDLPGPYLSCQTPARPASVESLVSTSLKYQVPFSVSISYSGVVLTLSYMQMTHILCTDSIQELSMKKEWTKNKI